MKIYIHPQETWDHATCKRKSKARGKDGYGSIHPYPGLISPSGSPYVSYGRRVIWNGGTVINGELYDGEEMPLPIIPDEYEFITRMSWGIYIQPKKEKSI